MKDALDRKRISPKADSPDSIDLTAEDALKSPKDVLALGRMIVRELKFAAVGTVLQRWMAHHLAEVLADVDNAEGQEKADAEERAVKLILELWRYRRALPDAVDPLAGIRDAIDILGLMAPGNNPWQYAHDGKDSVLLRETFNVLARVVSLGAVLGGIQQRQPSSEELQALSADERHLLTAVERWTPYAREKPKFPQEDLLKAMAYLGKSDPDHTEPNLRITQEREDQQTATRKEIVRELCDAKDALNKLIDRWRESIESQQEKTSP